MLTNELRELYDGYYTDSVARKRVISAKDSFRETRKVSRGQVFESLLDVGAGEGSVLQEMEDANFVKEISVAEISTSGIEAIKKRNLGLISEIKQFNGYEIPFADKQFDVAVATYVLEHVEHERTFLREMGRVAKRIIIAIPLEHTLRIKRSREAGKAIGHINFYTMETFRNVLETSGFKVESAHPYTTSREYEKFTSPKTGVAKYFLRRAALAALPGLASSVFTYMAIAMCKSPDSAS